MRVLILGATIFLGRHVVDEALRRGHELTLFTRGKHGTGPMGVEHVAGDRADVTPLHGRNWDAIDTSGYEPGHVKASRQRVSTAVWVRRIREGKPVPAPGRPDLGVQIIDARDLAAFLLDLAERRLTGAFNGTAPIGQTTMGELLAGVW